MPRPLLVAMFVLACAAPSARADESAIGSVRLPLPAADLAAAIGIHRVDPSTLPLDIVRLAFASPDGASPEESAARAKLSQALARRERGDLVPLPLSPGVWREHILRAQVADDDLAAAIFSRRSTALAYHALLGMDLETLGWMERNPAFVRALATSPGTAAVVAESIRVRGGVVDTPGEDARAMWTAIVGADPAQPAAFVTRLLSVDGGAIAALYHAVARLDAAHQAFAIGRRGEPGRVERARELLAATRTPIAAWNSERPFIRPDIDLLFLLRTVDVDDRGTPRPPASRRVWSKSFGDGPGGDAPIDAAWLARQVFSGTAAAARRRLDTLRFAQRAFGAATSSEADVTFALREQPRFPLLMGVLETLGERDAAAYAAAVRAAEAVEGDELATTLFQCGLAIIDRARRSQSLDDDKARRLAGSLARAATERDARRTLVAWIAETLLPSLRRAHDDSPDAERVVLEALAGRPVSPPIVIRWEGEDYTADVAPAELKRLTRIRRRQAEVPLDTALSRARGGESEPLARSLVAIVYACALGEADGATLNAGTVWRRHQLRGMAGQGGSAGPWRIATEVFAPDGWHLTGSLLRLDLALAPLALRRLDTTEMPGASHLSTSTRRVLATTIALVDPQLLTDGERDAIAAALARGRERIEKLPSASGDLDRVAADAALSGWRTNAVRWVLANEPARAAASFTLLEQLRIGGNGGADGWGASMLTIDGCICLRQPAAASWEEYTGRPASGQMAALLPDVMLRTANVLFQLKLPALLARDIAAYAMQDAMDRGRTAYVDDWLPLALAVRELPDDRFVDYIAALTAAGPLTPARGAR